MTLSPTWTFFDGQWHEGNPPIMGPRSHAFWLGSSVFDGARYFDGVMPDLARHFERVNQSAKTMYLKPDVSVDQWIALTHEGLKNSHLIKHFMSNRCIGRRMAREGKWRPIQIPRVRCYVFMRHRCPMVQARQSHYHVSAVRHLKQCQQKPRQDVSIPIMHAL